MPPLSRLSLAAALTLPISVLVYVKLMWPVGGLLDITGHAIGRDFVNVWNGPRLALAGDIAKLFDLHAYRATLDEVFGPNFKPHNWSYPPHALMLFLPFGMLSYPVALALWTVGTMGAFLAAVAAGAPNGRRRAAIAIAAIAPASVLDVVFGQNGHLTAALLLGGFACLDRRPILAGVLFGLLTIKPHLGILLPLVLLSVGAWRAILAATATTAALVAASILTFGIEPWRLYLEVTTGMQEEILANAKGMLIVMMPTVYQAAKTLAGHEAAWIAQAIVAAAVIPLTVILFRRAPDTASRAIVLCAGTLLTLPYAFNYDMGAIVWRALAADAGSEERWALIFAWIAPPVMIFTGLFDVPIGPLALAAALGAVALSQGWSRRREATAAQSAVDAEQASPQRLSLAMRTHVACGRPPLSDLTGEGSPA